MRFSRWVQSSRLRRFLATGRDREVLGAGWQPQKEDQIAHVEKERIEQGEFVSGGGVLGALLGHDHKKRAVEPDPSSPRWRQSFLRVGAFKKRSVRLEVRKKEFGPDELLEIENSPSVSSEEHAEIPSSIEGIPFDEFMQYLDDRLVEMESMEGPPEGVAVQLEREIEDRDEFAEQRPIEFRSMPFYVEPLPATKRKIRLKNWKTSGRCRTETNRFRTAPWMEEWSHMWSERHGIRSVPSSIRRWTHHPTFTTTPRKSLLYVEDTAAPEHSKRGSLPYDTSTILEFLKSQPAFRGTEAPSSRRKNSLWPKRRQGSELWSFVKELSEAIRQGDFRFDWEKEKVLEARLYQWKHPKSLSNPSIQRSNGVPLFGSHASLQERFPSLIRDSTFRIRTEDHEEKSDSDVET